MPLHLGKSLELRSGQLSALALSASFLVALSSNIVVAHEHGEMCGPITDGDGEAVVQSDGDIVMHSGSFPCPPKDAMPEPAAIEPIGRVVLFDFDIDMPNSEGDTALQEIIAELLDHVPVRVIVGGHADRAGTDAYNLDLSQRRAANVAKRLIAGGIDATAVTTEAFGETQPVVPTDDGVREPANRRVEIDTAL